MDEPDPNQSCPILELPTEIHDQIFGHLFFPGSQDPRQRVIRKIPKFDVAVIRSCNQLQSKVEAFLYGGSTWTFMFTIKLLSKPLIRPYEVLENLPARIRRLIQKVKIIEASIGVRHASKFRDVNWNLLMIFLARECPNLRKLDLSAGISCPKGENWVAANMQIETWEKALLQFLKISCLNWSITSRDFPCDLEVSEGVLSLRLDSDRIKKERNRVKLTLVSTSLPSNPSGMRDDSPRFDFLKLDRNIRDRIYSHILLPPKKRVHPYIKSWYDITTGHIVPLFSTCKQVYEEAASVFYNSAIFTFFPSEFPKSHGFLEAHLQDPLSNIPTLISRIRHVRITVFATQDNRMVFFFFKFMQLDSFTLAIPIGTLHDSLIEQLGMENEPVNGVHSRTWYTKHSSIEEVWIDVSRCIRLLNWWNQTFDDFNRYF